MGVVVGDAHGPGALGVGVAQLVGQVLELVRANVEVPQTDVARLPPLVPLLDDDEGDAGPVDLLQVHTRLPDFQ